VSLFLKNHTLRFIVCSRFTPGDTLNIWRCPQGSVNRLNSFGQDAALATAEEGAEKASLALQPAKPPVACRRVVGLETDDEAMFRAANVKGEIPAEILLAGFIGSLDTLCAELLNEPLSNVVAETAVVDEVVLRFTAVEGGAAKVNLGLQRQRF